MDHRVDAVQVCGLGASERNLGAAGGERRRRGGPAPVRVAAGQVIDDADVRSLFEEGSGEADPDESEAACHEHR